ncbi:hypothetical protein KMW28_23845 [Flammeovirga yaeyamensis]|uniref:Uncharacterized protein n=1 Tax=Flammeovirga yaeyamensis TaxID=367791 RepID=A0AAX1NDA9_9BACT|nr:MULTISPECIES: hypothetical protein [Flammeovirga]MBB3696590.1 magnesium-transporting ATPase (P-type) [Flammeovirga yaeyamensis]NMF33266.1 hypothetical protein [Flammeovirga yaeyamensis]QJD09374.1 hypothetical protein MY04_05545 [Flammeovirga sp. MY04]QWG05455.1 hypothetical protein KMW28_23845 [Flammeovirga yaeyamensis]
MKDFILQRTLKRVFTFLSIMVVLNLVLLYLSGFFLSGQEKNPLILLFKESVISLTY